MTGVTLGWLELNSTCSYTKQNYIKQKSMIKNFLILFAFVTIFNSCKQEARILPVELLCEAKVNPSGISTPFPRFSWQNSSSINKTGQTAWQIFMASSIDLLKEGKADLWDSEKVRSSNSVWIDYKGKELQSRSVGYWKVKVWDQNDNASHWSEIQSFSVGLLNKEDWQGDYIGMEGEQAALESPFLRQSFDLNGNYDDLFMHVNSLGYHELYINNKKVGDAVLAPAESQFNKRSFSLSYNVSSYLKEGKNTVVLWLGYGWYKHFKERVHNGPLVKAQLDGLKNGNWETLLKTDNNWKISESEYSILDISKFGGETLNANKISSVFPSPETDDSNWNKVSVFQVPDHLVTPQDVELNRFQEKIAPVEITKLEDQVYLVDMGKNLTGAITVNFPDLPRGQEITLQYSDFIYEKNEALFNSQLDKPGWKNPKKVNNLFRCNKINIFRLAEQEALPISLITVVFAI